MPRLYQNIGQQSSKQRKLKIFIFLLDYFKICDIFPKIPPLNIISFLQDKVKRNFSPATIFFRKVLLDRKATIQYNIGTGTKTMKNKFTKTTIVFGMLAAAIPIGELIFPVVGLSLHVGLICIGAWRMANLITNGK